MDGVDDPIEHIGVWEPWHVPALRSDGPVEDVPPEVLDAAKRALGARRPGAEVLDLVDESVDPVEGACRFQFSDSSLSVDVRSRRQGACAALEIRCLQRAGGRVEVRHGGLTVEVTLDEEGIGDVQVSSGPLSLVLNSADSALPPAQTMWVRLP